MTQVAFPYHLDDGHRTATADAEEHIRQMLELVLLSARASG